MSKRTRWYRLTAYTDGEKVAECGDRPVMLRSRFFDADGEQLLMAVRLDIDDMPHHALGALIKTLTLAELSPILVFGPHADLVRLEELSELEARNQEDQYNKAKDDVREPEQQLQQLIEPASELPKNGPIVQ